MEPARIILVGFDFGEESERALTTALEMASDAEGAEVHVLYVMQPPVDPMNAYALPPPPGFEKDVERLRDVVLRHVRATIQRRGALKIKQVTVHGAIGAPAREIARLAAQLSADLVLVGTHGRRGLDRAFLGSVAEKVVRLCGCPTLVVRSKDHRPLQKPPEIEPICPDCAQRRFETGGKMPWCARHSEHHVRAHVYSYEGFSMEPVHPWGFG